MRIRWSFAAGFVVLLLFSSSFGLLPHSALPSAPKSAQDRLPAQSDKAFHFIWLFALTAIFYFIFDTARRRVLHLTLLVCTLGLGVGSEVLQGLLPNGRDFDPFDVLANVLGSLAALGLAGAYHRRAADRRRRAKYAALTGEPLDGEDLELGEGPGLGRTSGDLDDGQQETGIISTTPLRPKSVQEELDNWDENAADDVWDVDDEDATTGQGTASTKITPATSSVGSEDVPKKIATE